MVFDRADSGLVVANGISGSGSVTQIGTGMVTLGGTNTYTGTTLISAGMLALGNSLAIQDSTLNISGTGSLSFGGLTSATVAGLSGGGNLVLANTAGAAVALSVGANNSSTTYSGVLSDNAAGGSLIKLGTGRLTLTGSSTYAGPTTITAGTLQIGNGTTTGSIASSSGISDNATLAYNFTGSQTCANIISGSGALYKTGGGTLTLTGNNTYSGATTVNGGCLVGNTASLPGAITVANKANVTFNQAVSGTFSNTISGAGSLTVEGPGALTLAASNSYSGGTLIQGEIVNVVNASALGSGAVTLAGGTLGMASTAPSGSIGVQFVGEGNPITGSAGVAPMSNWNSLSPYAISYSNVALTDSSGAATTARLTISMLSDGVSGSSNQLLNGYMLSGGQLTATVSGIPYPSYDIYAYIADSVSGYPEEVSLGGNNYYFSTINCANFVQITNNTAGTYPSGNNATALGTLTTVYVAAGTTFSLGASQTVAALSDEGTVVPDGSTVLLNGNTLTIGGNNNLSSTFSGVIADGTGGPGSLITAGTGTLTLGGCNTYSGTTTIGGGTLVLANSAALQQSTLNTSGSGILSFGSLTAVPLGGLAGSGTVTLLNASSSPVALSVGANNASTTFSGCLNGGSNLTKLGSGVLCLAGTNSYAGTTAVNAGMLEASTTAALPNYAAASQVSVASGATLAVNVGGPNDWPSANVDSLLAAVSFAPGANFGLDTTNGNFVYGTNITGGIGLVWLIAINLQH